jgi:DNA repair protein RadA/Sms
MLIAVLQRRVGLDLTSRDIYAATVGGALLRSPATDLAIAVSLASAALDLVVPPGTVTIGEVGLAGELRRVPNISQRLSEAARLGFTSAVVPRDDHGQLAAGAAKTPGLDVISCDGLSSALTALQLGGRAGPGDPLRLRTVR